MKTIWILVIVILMTGSGTATTIFVPDDYSKIQWAIDNSSIGDTIDVNSGTYYENLNVTKQQLILRGVDTGNGTPTIFGKDNNDNSIYVSVSGVTIEGFIIKNPINPGNAGIYLNGVNNVNIINNILTDNSVGIYLLQSDHNNIRNNLMKSNVSIQLFNSNDNDITNNDIKGYIPYPGHSKVGTAINLWTSYNNRIYRNNMDNLGNGIWSENSNGNIIHNNTIVNVEGFGILISNSAKGVIQDNNISYNGAGLNLAKFYEYKINDNNISFNRWYGIEVCGYTYEQVFNNIIYNNIFDNNVNIENCNPRGNHYWNITKMKGINIIGGPFIGGNFWAQPDENGYSQKCLDSESDGLCDLPYEIDINNIDYMPLSTNFKKIYNFSGFFQPIDNLPMWNSAKAGSAIPVKFGLDGDQGLDIFVEGYPVSNKIDCDSKAPVEVIEETVATGSSNLSYNATIDQYSYIWKTDKSWSNSCRQLTILLKDGTYHNASFNFK